MLSRTRILIAVSAAAAIAVTAALLVRLTGDPTDPRRVWAAAAEEICSTSADSTRAVGVPVDFRDGDGVRAWAARNAAIQRDLAHGLAAIDTPNDDVAAMSAVAANAAATRAAGYEQLAQPGSELPDPVTGAGGFGDEFADTYTRTADAVARWGAPTCGDVPLLTGGGSSPQMRWLETLEGACRDAGERFVEADGDVESTDSYLADVAEIAGDLHTQLESAGAPPEGDEDAYTAFLGTVSHAAASAESGDLEATRAANAAWQQAATALDLGACAQGIVGAPAAPSGLIARPDVVVTGEGLDGDAVADADVVLGYTIPQLTAAVRPDPADAFGTRELVPLIVAGNVSGTGGAVPATPHSVSVSDARLVDPDAEPSESNMWVVGVAVADTNGRCARGQLVGHPKPFGYTAVETGGPCTGDVAAAVPQP